MRPASDDIALTLRLTALLLLLRAQGPILVYTALVGIGALMLLDARALQRSLLWYAAAALLAIRIAADWPLADNHIYLLGYWCLAIALALDASDRLATLRSAARWLLGAAFALAVLWKAVLSADFVDGRFFRMTLIVDQRFEDVVRIAGGMSLEEIDRHRAALVPLGQGAVLAVDDTLVEPAQFRRLALLLTWGGLLMETALAVAFAAPLAVKREWWRHALLLTFCAATYPVAPVAGFGWLLLAMGAVRRPPGVGWSAGYICVWLWVLAGTELPWARWVADLGIS